MTTYSQHRFFSDLSDTALDAAIEADVISRGGQEDGTEKSSAFIDSLKTVLNEAAAGDIMAVDSIRRLHSATASAADQPPRTVDNLLSLFGDWILKLEQSLASRQPAALKEIVKDVLEMHSYALSFIKTTREAENPRIRRLAA